jgi:hypothetical protein
MFAPNWRRWLWSWKRLTRNDRKGSPFVKTSLELILLSEQALLSESP